MEVFILKAIRAVLDYLSKGGVKYIFGIPAGSVNALFDELFTMPHITPVVAKHEGAAAYMAAAYARYSNQIGVCIGCSGPGSSNLLTGAANAMREQLPLLFLTGAVPNRTLGLNASQELDVEHLFRPVTKYSVTVLSSENLLEEVSKAVEIALSGIPGPVHVAMPIDVQLNQIVEQILPEYPSRSSIYPNLSQVKLAAMNLAKYEDGYIFIGQGARQAMDEVIKIAELLNWQIVTTPQAKGHLPSSHPLNQGVYGFAGQASALSLINEGSGKAILIIGSSLGETATNNWNTRITENRFVIQIDHDASVINRVYNVDVAVIGDAKFTLELLLRELEAAGLKRNVYTPVPSIIEDTDTSQLEFNTQNVLLSLQKHLPPSTRYCIDIGEFMAYVIQHMKVLDAHTFDINVHFGAMGTGIGSAIGMKLALPSQPVVCITGDGCFFMHGMEILTAKEYKLPILFIVINNARLGMVYHGHKLQYKRSHSCFEQIPINIAELAKAMAIPSARIEKMEDLTSGIMESLTSDGPSILEIALVDNNIPPMGDRVKFLSTIGK
jgi:acetolactate synthase-1/2/3 large subunit